MEQRHVDVHSGARNAVDRLGHEGSMQAVALRSGLDDLLKGDDVIRRDQRLIVLEINLVLAARHLVVAGFDFKAHVLEHHAHLAAGDFALVGRTQVEVTALVIGAGGRLAGIVGMEQEELQLRPDVEFIAHLAGALQHAFEHIAGVALKGPAISGINVADQAGDLSLLAPGQDTEAVRIGIEAHIALLDAGKALDGRSVEAAVVLERLFHLAGGDGDALHRAENIGKLQAKEANVVFAHHADDVLRRVLCHVKNSSSISSGSDKRLLYFHTISKRDIRAPEKRSVALMDFILASRRAACQCRAG